VRDTVQSVVDPRTMLSISYSLNQSHGSGKGIGTGLRSREKEGHVHEGGKQERLTYRRTFRMRFPPSTM